MEQELRDSLAALNEQLRLMQEQLSAQQTVISRQEAQLAQQADIQPTIELNHPPPNQVIASPIQAAPETCNPAVARIGVHLPPFYASEPQLWFSVAESAFRTAHITAEETKYHYVVQHIGVQLSNEVKDLIIDPPATDPYSTLKQELILRLGLSQMQKTKQLLELEQLGDSKASQFLRRLKDLGGTLVSDELIRTMWLSRLPTLVQAILASQLSLPLNALASLADSIMETTSGPQVALVANPSKSSREISKSSNCPDVSPSTLADLFHQIRLMREEISTLKSHSSRAPSRTGSTTNKRNRSKTPNRSQSRLKSSLCWYHRNWGTNATKCNPPCSFNDNQPSASGASSSSSSQTSATN